MKKIIIAAIIVVLIFVAFFFAASGPLRIKCPEYYNLDTFKGIEVYVSATTLEIYSHITTEMQISAAQKIDKGIGKVDTTIREDDVPMPKKRERMMTDFKPQQGKIRKSGTGGIYQISENLWEGRFTPTNAQGKREAHNVYTKTREECEILLAEMIKEMKAEIQAEKELLKQEQSM